MCCRMLCLIADNTGFNLPFEDFGLFGVNINLIMLLDLNTKYKVLVASAQMQLKYQRDSDLIISNNYIEYNQCTTSCTNFCYT